MKALTLFLLYFLLRGPLWFTLGLVRLGPEGEREKERQTERERERETERQRDTERDTERYRERERERERETERELSDLCTFIFNEGCI